MLYFEFVCCVSRFLDSVYPTSRPARFVERRAAPPGAREQLGTSLAFGLRWETRGKGGGFL